MFTQKDFLHCDGMTLRNEAGKTVALRGTNFGGWLLREGWQDGSGAARKPVDHIVAARSDTEVLFDLTAPGSCNRIGVLQTQGGAYTVCASDDGVNYRMIGAGDFSSPRAPHTPEDRPAAYNLYHQNPLDDGCFYDGNCIHTPEVKSRYLRVTAEKPILLYGLQLYEYWDDFTPRKVLAERFGEDKADELIHAYEQCYIREADVRYIKSLGFNFIRVPIYWRLIMNRDGRLRDDAFDILDWLVNLCTELEIYVMLDLHGLPGGQQGGGFASGHGGANKLWQDETCKRMSETIWRAIAAHYRGNPAVAMYDLMNEPAPVDIELMFTSRGDPALRAKIGAIEADMYDRLYRAAREADPEHIVSVGLFLDNRLLKAPREYGWENVVYQTHEYFMGDWSSEDAVLRSVEACIQEHRELQADWQTPMLNGELNLWGHEKAWRRWLHAMNEMGISWSTWTYKNTDPEKKHSWGIYYDFQGQYADYYKDDYDTILQKYSSWGSENYKRNDDLARILSEMARS